MRIQFNPSERTSLGVEWELQLVDLADRHLTGRSDDILAAITPPGVDDHPKAKHELLTSCIEVITGVCDTVAQARLDLAATVAEVSAAAAEYDVGLMCAGTHPLSDWRAQQISSDERYHGLINRTQVIGRQMEIFGVHVHCGVRSADKVIPIVNALLAYLPHFLSLSASSPYWIGADTGMASYRSKVFEALPTAGLPYQLDDWAAFEGYMEALIRSKAIDTIRDVWWDVRPHPNFGTVELRICDGIPTLDEISAVAALAQCLVHRFDGQLEQGYTLPVPLPWLVRENKWRAARFGLEAEIVVDNAGTTRPVVDSIAELVDDLMPVAARLDCQPELELVTRLITEGASYQRQRAVAAAHDGDLTAVVDSLLAEMRDGLPLPTM